MRVTVRFKWSVLPTDTSPTKSGTLVPVVLIRCKTIWGQRWFPEWTMRGGNVPFGLVLIALRWFSAWPLWRIITWSSISAVMLYGFSVSPGSTRPPGGLARRPGPREAWRGTRPSSGAKRRCCRRHRSCGSDSSQPCSWSPGSKKILEKVESEIDSGTCPRRLSPRSVPRTSPRSIPKPVREGWVRDQFREPVREWFRNLSEKVKSENLSENDLGSLQLPVTRTSDPWDSELPGLVEVSNY
jgi:hypothetical protein